MGAHPIKEHGKLVAFCFSVWAPNASEVSVIGSFNGWDGFKSRMKRQENGVWSTVINGVPSGASYKYLIRTRFGETFYRTDPCAKYAEPRPLAASKLVRKLSLNDAIPRKAGSQPGMEFTANGNIGNPCGIMA